MTLAIIRTGGKQYLVKKGDKIKIEKIEGKEGSNIKLTEVLLLDKEKTTEIGKPFVKNAEVSGKILKQAKDKKVVSYKYKAKKRYSKKTGHRQFFTEVGIIEIK